MKRSKEQKGITLIALIITIIVLLILAVVAIGAVQNDGIINHSKNARDEYGKAQVNENTTLQNYLIKLNENAEIVETGAFSRLKLIGEASVELDGTITLVAQLDGKALTAEEVEWKSLNTEAATVVNGVVTGIHAKKGTAIIVATSKTDNTLIGKKEITVTPKPLGNCEECTEGVVLAYKCPTCNELNDAYSDENEYMYDLYCYALIREGEDSWYCDGSAMALSTDPNYCEATCGSCGATIKSTYSSSATPTRSEALRKFNKCGHHVELSYIDSCKTTTKCSKCTNGKLYDYGD